MSLIDKIIDAITPQESAQDRRAARDRAKAASVPEDWLYEIAGHHQRIDDAFAILRQSATGHDRQQGLRHLAVVLTANAIAKEAVIYPALIEAGEGARASIGYEEQGRIKVAMAALEKIDPATHAFADKLAEIERMTLTHLFREENGPLLALKDKAPVADQYMISARYLEEYRRYVGG